MKEINVKTCNDCPFYLSIDNLDTFVLCCKFVYDRLSDEDKENEEVLQNIDTFSVRTVPKECVLRTEPVLIKFEEEEEFLNTVY